MSSVRMCVAEQCEGVCVGEQCEGVRTVCVESCTRAQGSNKRDTTNVDKACRRFAPEITTTIHY